MKTFNKSHKLDHVAYDVRGPLVDMADQMIRNNKEVIKLNIGNPFAFGFNAPEEVIQDMMLNLRSSQGYSDSKGIFPARKAIMQYHQLKGLKGIMIDDIYTGNGVSELIQMTMHALCNAGDEVLVPAPDYPLWSASISLASGTPVHYICDDSSDWFPDVEDIKSKITDKTKAIVLINPNNPTGAVYDKQLLLDIAEVAREHDLMVFSDEIYDQLVMDGIEHHSFAALAPDLFCVTFNGISKSHRAAGFRAGWMVITGPKRRAKSYIEGLNMMSSMRLCSNVPAQSIIQTCLGGTQSTDAMLQPGGRYYEQREYVYNALIDIPGITAVKPKAAFYIFPKVDVKKFNITSDVQFMLDFLQAKRVLMVQGTGFNWPKPDHFRIVYLPRVEELRVAVNRLAEFLETYQQQ